MAISKYTEGYFGISTANHSSQPANPDNGVCRRQQHTQHGQAGKERTPGQEKVELHKIHNLRTDLSRIYEAFLHISKVGGAK